MLAIQGARGLHLCGAPPLQHPQASTGVSRWRADLSSNCRGFAVSRRSGFSSESGTQRCCLGTSRREGQSTFGKSSDFGCGDLKDSWTNSGKSIWRRRCKVNASKESFFEGSVTTTTSTESRESSTEVESESQENGSATPPDKIPEGNGVTPSLTRSNSRGANGNEKFENQLKRVAAAANINGR